MRDAGISSVNDNRYLKSDAKTLQNTKNFPEKMTDQMEYIVPPWEIEAYVQSLNVSDLENVGMKR